jgi:hypothetical protein
MYDTQSDIIIGDAIYINGLVVKNNICLCKVLGSNPNFAIFCFIFFPSDFKLN